MGSVEVTHLWLESHCQRKVEMSAFLPNRNVRLQGWSGGGMYLLLVLGFSASPGGRRPEGLVEKRGAAGQGRSPRYEPRKRTQRLSSSRCSISTRARHNPARTCWRGTAQVCPFQRRV